MISLITTAFNVLIFFSQVFLILFNGNPFECIRDVIIVYIRASSSTELPFIHPPNEVPTAARDTHSEQFPLRHHEQTHTRRFSHR